MALVDAAFRASFKDARARTIATTYDADSPDCFDARDPGRQAVKLVTLTAAGNPVYVDLFQFTGLIRLNNITGIFEDVTNVDDLEELGLDVWDGAVAVAITAVGAADMCDGATLHSALAKVDDATGALEFMDADQVRIVETNKHSNLDPVLLNTLDGVTCYVRLRYKNTDTNLNCQIMWRAGYRSYAGQSGGTFAAA